MHYYSFHPGDYLKDTAHLSLLEDATYRRLIDFYYISEQPIPVATQSVARRLRLDCQMVDAVLAEFFELREDGWHQARCDDEIEAYHALCQRNRINGKAGGRRKRTQSQPSGNPVATQMGGQIKANQYPLTNNHKPMNGDAGASKSAASKPKRELKAQPIDDAYLAKLQSEYPHAKVSEQFANCTKWWLEKKKVHPSRRALVNWLDKVQPPPSASASLINSGLGDRCSVL
jgi:uncharacterized protein YdaU (DUF1376 family)